MGNNNTPKKPSQEILDHIIDKYTYDREKGQVFNTRKGNAARKISKQGYGVIKVSLNGKALSKRTHHLVWLFEYGEWPTSCMDHIDGVKTNNHYTNLRLVTSRENTQAHRLSVKSSSPYHGVDWNKSSNRFQARIRCGTPSKQKFLGYFTCEVEAARAYDKALVGMGFKPVNVEIIKELIY